MSNKNYPRIYSLSTVGIRNHYNSDYLFHPFRTDFAGDSGVGKSIIADILQLILVGERVFKSATDSSSEREARKLITERYGYVFLNIAIETEKYIVIGMYISSVSIDPFIIQQNIGLDEFEPLPVAISSKDFMYGDDIIDLTNLPEKMKEKHAYAVKLPLNKYHELLEQNKIIPLDLKTEGNLKNFAQIIRSFSRGKGFKNNSKWLKEFFLNDERENIIMARFDEQLSDISQELKDHKENKDTLERVRIKYDKFKRLHNLKKERDAAQEEYLRTKLLFHYTTKNKALKDCSMIESNTISINCKIANSLYCLLLAQLEEQQKTLSYLHDHFGSITKARQDIDAHQQKESIALQKYPNLDEQFIQVQKVDSLLNIYGSYENLFKAHAKLLDDKKEKELLKNLVDDLRQQKLYNDWVESPWAKSIDEGSSFYKERNVEIEAEVKRLTVLKDFSDVTNIKSFAYWIIHNQPLLSHEEESVLFSLNAILVEKPMPFQKDTQYIPEPESFLKNLIVAEKENNPEGFWVDWGGIRRFITYIPERFFTTKNSNEITNYFNEKHKDAMDLIKSLNKEKETLEGLQKLAVKHGEKAVKAFTRKHEILAYIIDENLDISFKQLDDLRKIHFNCEDIKKTKSDLEEANKLKIHGDTVLYHTKNELKQMFDVEFSKDSSFEEIKSKIQQLLVVENNLFKAKQNRIIRVQQIFSNYISNIETFKTADVIGLHSELKNNLWEKRYNRKELRELKSKIQEEDRRYSQALLDYQAHVPQQIDFKSIVTDNNIFKPEDKERQFDSANNAYKQAYDSIVIEFINEKLRHRFLGHEDYLALTREVVNEIPAKQLVSNETDALKKMLDFLKQLNDTHINIGNRKLNLIKEIFQDVRDAVSDYVAKMYDIGIYFKGSDKQISQGFKLSLTCPFSSIYPINWIDTFLEMLNDSVKRESIHQDLFAALRERIDIPDMMATAFEKCGGFKNAKIEDLLNPKNYFDIKFDMESDDGERNVGSAGQTYAVTAMLCVARLSLVEKRENGKQQRGLRFMPIDEAEGIGSNFDLLERIAKANDYQLISMSINPLDDFKDGEQYLYILNGSKKRKERISTFAIFSNSDEIIKYDKQTINMA